MAIELGPDTMPPSLEGKGYTGNVVASRQRDRIMEIVRSNSFASGTLRFAQSAPELKIPGMEFSLTTLVSMFQSFIGIQARRVTGEFLLKDEMPHLTLRVPDGNTMHVAEFASDDPRQAIQDSADFILEIVDPLALGMHYYYSKDKRSLRDLIHSSRKHARSKSQKAASFMLEGRFHFLNEDWEKAREAMGRAIQEDGGTEMAHYMLGVSHYKQEHYVEAAAEFGNVLAIDPGYTRALWVWGDMLLYQGEFDEARKKYEKATGIDSEDYHAFRGWGDLLPRPHTSWPWNSIRSLNMPWPGWA